MTVFKLRLINLKEKKYVSSKNANPILLAMPKDQHRKIMKRTEELTEAHLKSNILQGEGGS